jgi:hypothetical protein
VAEPHVSCVQCGAQLPPRSGVGRPRKRCVSCKSKGPSSPRWPDGIPASHKEHVCRECGATFRPKRAGRTTYCGRECAFASRTQRKAAEKASPRYRVCATCGGAPVEGRNRVCGGCKAAAKEVARNALKIPRQRKPCLDCGTEIFGTAGKKRCKTCARRRSIHQQAEKHGRTKKHRHRARRYGVAYHPVSPAKVFSRDGWRCQMCGGKTPSRLRGTNDPRAPEMDHRIPMAMGGDHTYENVQCSCRACNIRKGGTRALGQMHLFPQ